ncbi:hypothetical protein [Marinoscillum furvescens]|uniref:hypothetical protein n=1 Tax=Marinoscillum furvescens TaxID=1026 RepID=UPI0011C032CE|nr:hypothetical protein [Marinoscillum furvescens]
MTSHSTSFPEFTERSVENSKGIPVLTDVPSFSTSLPLKKPPKPAALEVFVRLTIRLRKV